MHSAAAAFIKLSSVKTDPSPESWILDSPRHSSRELFLFLQADHWRRDTSPNTCGTYLSLIWLRGNNHSLPLTHKNFFSGEEMCVLQMFDIDLLYSIIFSL